MIVITITIRSSCNIWLLIIIRERKWSNIFIKRRNNISYISYLFLFLFLVWYNFLICCCPRFLKIFTITTNIIIFRFSTLPLLFLFLSLYLTYYLILILIIIIIITLILYNLYNLLCSYSLFWLYLTHLYNKLF